MLRCVGVSADVAVGFTYYVIVVKKFNNEMREAEEAAPAEDKILCTLSLLAFLLLWRCFSFAYALSKEPQAADANRSAAEIWLFTVKRSLLWFAFRLPIDFVLLLSSIFFTADPKTVQQYQHTHIHRLLRFFLFLWLDDLWFFASVVQKYWAAKKRS